METGESVAGRSSRFKKGKNKHKKKSKIHQVSSDHLKGKNLFKEHSPAEILGDVGETVLEFLKLKSKPEIEKIVKKKKRIRKIKKKRVKPRKRIKLRRPASPTIQKKEKKKIVKKLEQKKLIRSTPKVKKKIKKKVIPVVRLVKEKPNKIKKKKAGAVPKKTPLATYETEIDALYNLLRGKGKISLEEVTRTFKISKELAEEWARILETHNLITVHYPPFGAMELLLKEEKDLPPGEEAK